MDPMLEFAHVETIDPGVYRWENGRPSSWQEVLTGDRLYTLLKTREKTFGSIYSFRTQCGQLGCREPIRWDLDISKLEVKPLSKESKEQFLSSEPFEYKLPNGQTVLYHLELGKHEGRASQQVDPISASILSRLEQIDDEKHFNNLVKIVEDMDADYLDELRADMEDKDCGVETSFEVVCDECGAETTIELPFDRTFFMPKSGNRSRPRSDSSSSDS